ncbi:ketopantoate reductase family protein [Texcoconibacillus texcoconensis]|uniref:2-dehydropantoate 2-reductase n=1 Tax=Texcoconibacillus texcoconensis TaxID=1095777 RepID=A0A840QST6_9BACI|nr:2-dehydropantoate 2-reductase [Texcoconibacillus texcoconensis]MBB5174582.1 2-dehydropantoate 2-reductase [Texcoconibacillus texcoconensis]
MKFTFIGAGAIGGVVGAYLAKAGEDVTLVDVNEEHINEIQKNGLNIQTQEESWTTKEVKAKTMNDLKKSKEPLDVVVLAVKAQHTSEAVNDIKDLLQKDSVVISMQNGLTENIISSIIGQDRTIGSFVNLFADYLEPGLIQYGGVGSLFIGELSGELSPRLLALEEKFKAWGDAKATDNIYGYLWSKLAFGAILTATATVDEKMAEVINPTDNRKMFVELATEVLKVADQNGIQPMSFDNWEPNIIYQKNKERDWDTINEHFDKLVARLRSYKKVKSGIWRDLAVRKRKTEVPFHLSPVIERGQDLNIDMSLTKKTLDLIVELENQEREMSWENIESLKQLANQKQKSLNG